MININDSGSMIVWLIGVLIWVAIAFWPSRVAQRKGRSYWLFFIFSLIFFPGAIIAAYVLPPKRG